MIGINDILKLTKQLYPTGRAFNLKPGSVFDKLHTGLGQSELRAWQDANSILNSILPDNDNFSDKDATQWEGRLGMITNISISLADRKAAILRKMKHPGSIKARQNYLYVEGQLQEAGFDVHVFENIFQNGNLPALSTFLNYTGPGATNWSLGSPPSINIGLSASSVYLYAPYQCSTGNTYSLSYNFTRTGTNSTHITIGFLDSSFSDIGNSTFIIPSGTAGGSVNITPSIDTSYIYVLAVGGGGISTSNVVLNSLSISPTNIRFAKSPSVYGIMPLPTLSQFLNYTGPGSGSWTLSASPLITLAVGANSKYLYAPYFCPKGNTYTLNYDITKSGANPDITIGFLDSTFTPIASSTFTVSAASTVGSINLTLTENATYVYVYDAGVFSSSTITINSLTINSSGNSYELIVNNIDASVDNLFDPGSDFKSTFFIGGSSVGSSANIDATRKDEFRQLVLKLKPCQTVAFAFINYV